MANPDKLKKKEEINYLENMDKKSIFLILDFDNLMYWWLSIIFFIASLIFYYSVNISPLRELLVLGAIILFIITSVVKFMK